MMMTTSARNPNTNLKTIPHRAAMAGIPLTARQAELMGMLRLRGLVKTYGITSPIVLRSLEIWGDLIDQINHPPCRCKNCPEPVVWDSSRAIYIHPGRPITSNQWCLTKAGAIAERSNYEHAG